MSASDHDADGAPPSAPPTVPADAPSTDRRDTGSREAAERDRRAAETSRDRFAFLAEVSRCLADSLDYETTLTTVAGMSLPYLGAWCIVDVLAEGGRIRRLAVLHPDPARESLARELHERYPPQPDDLIGAPRVIRMGRPELVSDVSDAALAATAHDAEHLRLLRALGTRAYVTVPMVARGQTLGAITFVTADDARRFGDLDVVIAEDLASRAAMAIDNARLFAEADAAGRRAESAAIEARRARDDAEAALRARDQFVSMMSHELRTPVNAIIGYAQLLQLGVAGPVTEQQRDYLARLVGTSEHLRGLVDDVLDLARIDAGWMTVAREPCLTGGLVATALDLVRPQASARGVRLVDARPGDPGEPFTGDPHRVRQILANLLSNAVKFTPAGGTVTIDCGRSEAPPPDSELRGDGPWTYIRVADTGIGIPPEEQPRVFERFYQVQGALNRQVGGTGLGLAISRRLARLMGGDLTLESVPGEGATFTLWLPGAAAGVSEGVVEAVAGAMADHGARARQEPGLPPRVIGLAEVGAHLREQLERIVAAYAARLRGDPTIPAAAHLRRSELEDHQLSFLADVAQTLVVVEDMGGPESDLLRDGSTIQRVIAELHGAMRQARGWTEAQLVREYAILAEELTAAVRRGGVAGAGDVSLAVEVLDRLIDRARATGLAALRRNAESGPGREG
ncbi:MAG TPA: GAF domain-containing sensor histidine kinase [Gemmatimonadaceae bacterium]|nr:GAF domain-containing sensor histidine kinase [Gemmatimonadaceae bacterium]